MAQHLLDQTDLRPTGDHFDLCQRVYRDWNGEADYLTQKAKEDGPSWKSFQADGRVEAIRISFVGRDSLRKKGSCRRKRIEAERGGRRKRRREKEGRGEILRAPCRDIIGH